MNESFTVCFELPPDKLYLTNGVSCGRGYVYLTNGWRGVFLEIMFIFSVKLSGGNRTEIKYLSFKSSLKYFFYTICGVKVLSVSLTRMNGLRYSVVMDCTIQHSREQYNNKSLQPFWHQSHDLSLCHWFLIEKQLMWIINHLTSQHKIMAQDKQVRQRIWFLWSLGIEQFTVNLLYLF